MSTSKGSSSPLLTALGLMLMATIAAMAYMIWKSGEPLQEN